MRTFSLLLAFVVAGVSCSPRVIPVRRDDPVATATADLTTGGQGVSGLVTFQQFADGTVRVSGTVSGLGASAQHGFHVHSSGDLTDGCASAGAHFNPDNTNHGAQTATRPNRHVGDLGNINADASGAANINIEDTIISLSGDESIVGLSVVVHSGQDDLGLGGNAGSLENGNSGSRVACGVIVAS